MQCMQREKGENAPLLCQKKENTLELNFLCIHKSWKLRQPKTEGVRGRELEGHHNNNTQMQTNKYEKNEEEARETHTHNLNEYSLDHHTYKYDCKKPLRKDDGIGTSIQRAVVVVWFPLKNVDVI